MHLFWRSFYLNSIPQIVPSSEDKSAKKVSTVPKTVQFLKSSDGTDNGTKKVSRYCPPLVIIYKQQTQQNINNIQVWAILSQFGQFR